MDPLQEVEECLLQYTDSRLARLEQDAARPADERAVKSLKRTQALVASVYRFQHVYAWLSESLDVLRPFLEKGNPDDKLIDGTFSLFFDALCLSEDQKSQCGMLTFKSAWFSLPQRKMGFVVDVTIPSSVAIHVVYLHRSLQSAACFLLSYGLLSEQWVFGSSHDRRVVQAVFRGEETTIESSPVDPKDVAPYFEDCLLAFLASHSSS